jgi:hypothetical protein
MSDSVNQMNRPTLSTAASTVLAHGAISCARGLAAGYPFHKPSRAFVSGPDQWLGTNPEMDSTGKR